MKSRSAKVNKEELEWTVTFLDSLGIAFEPTEEFISMAEQTGAAKFKNMMYELIKTKQEEIAYSKPSVSQAEPMDDVERVVSEMFK